MSRLDALSRMLLLTRDWIASGVSDDAIADAFQNTVVRCVVHESYLATAAGQSAVVSLVTQVARMGVQVEVDIPDTRLVGYQPPVVGETLLAALVDIGGDLIPGTRITRASGSPDIEFLLGCAKSTDGKARTFQVDATDWSGTIRSSPLTTAAPPVNSWPVGALTASGLASAEVFKHVMRRLPLADAYHKKFFAPVDAATWNFAPDQELLTPGTVDLGPLTIVSAGAITQSALFVLYRLPGVSAIAEVYEDDVTELSNVNRNMLTRRRDVGRLKAPVVVACAPPTFELQAVTRQFGIENVSHLGRAIVGVDDIPSRWSVQRAEPTWLGVAGTTHAEVSCSSHVAREPCVGCLHHEDDPGNDAIPTVSFVSFWAGLSLAVSLVREVLGKPRRQERQHVWISPLRMDTSAWRWSPVAARRDCPVGCSASRMMPRV